MQYQVSKINPPIQKMLITSLGKEYQDQLKISQEEQNDQQFHLNEEVNNLQKRNFNIMNTSEPFEQMHNFEKKISKLKTQRQVYEHLQSEIKTDSRYILGLMEKASLNIHKARGQQQETLKLPPLNLKQKSLLNQRNKSLPDFYLELNSFKSQHNSFLGQDLQSGSIKKMVSMSILEKERIERIQNKHEQYEQQQQQQQASSKQLKITREQSPQNNQVKKPIMDEIQMSQIQQQYKDTFNIFDEQKKQFKRKINMMKALHQRKYASHWKSNNL